MILYDPFEEYIFLVKCTLMGSSNIFLLLYDGWNYLLSFLFAR